MKFPAGKVHIFWLARGIQSAQLLFKYPCMLWLNAGFRSGSEELLNALTPEGLNHVSSVALHYSLAKRNHAFQSTRTASPTPSAALPQAAPGPPSATDTALPP